jgi:chromosome segregation ATPase
MKPMAERLNSSFGSNDMSGTDKNQFITRLRASFVYSSLAFTFILSGFPAQAQTEETASEATTPKETKWEEPENKATASKYTFKVSSESGEHKAIDDSEGSNTNYYPDGALKAAYEAQLKELQATEDAERKAVYTHEKIEKDKIDAQEEITRLKRQKEALKMRQEKAFDEAEMMQNELIELEGHQKETMDQLSQVEDQAKVELSKNGEVKKQLDSTRKKLKASVDALAKVREETAQNVYKYQVEMQQLRTQILQSETMISRLENDKVRSESEELQVRTEWAALSSKNNELALEKNRSLAELNEMKKHLEVARRDYAIIKKGTDDLNREVKALQAKSDSERAKTLAEIRHLDEQTAIAYSQKARNEAEKTRLASEIESLNQEVAMVKKKNEDAIAARDDSNSLVMESRLAFETSKAELNRELANYENIKLKDDTRRIKVRNLASIAEQNDMLDGQTVGRAIKNCKIRREPANDAKIVGDLVIGMKVIAAPAEGSWYKLMNVKGNPQFVDESCVRTQDK